MTGRLSRVECPEKTGWATWETDRVFFVKNCVLYYMQQGLDMSGLEVRGQKIPTPANENSTDFQQGTDDTKGYRGGDLNEK